MHLTKKDFNLDWFSGKGGGGQYRNKHQNCCRITHLKTGMVETGQSHRDRPSNQREAFNKLAKRLIAIEQVREGRTISNERVRTYHAERNEVIDHASGVRSTYHNVVENTNIGRMVEARKEALGANDSADTPLT